MPFFRTSLPVWTCSHSCSFLAGDPWLGDGCPCRAGMDWGELAEVCYSIASRAGEAHAGILCTNNGLCAVHGSPLRVFRCLCYLWKASHTFLGCGPYWWSCCAFPCHRPPSSPTVQPPLWDLLPAPQLHVVSICASLTPSVTDDLLFTKPFQALKLL